MRKSGTLYIIAGVLAIASPRSSRTMPSLSAANPAIATGIGGAIL